MSDHDPADEIEMLLLYLRRSREALLTTLAGLSEYDVRRPLTPSATNLLGTVKHVASVELGYLGDCVGRPHGLDLPWDDDASYDERADMWVTAEESRDQILDLYRAAAAHTEDSVRTLGLDAPAEVPWWPEERRRTTVRRLVVHMIQETAQHAGQCEVAREGIDGRGSSDHDEVGDATWWAAHLARVRAAADAFGPS